MRDLRRNADHLETLHTDFLEVAAGTDLQLRNYKEERRIGPGKIVPDDSADPLFEGIMFVGLTGNHSEVSKPRGASSPIVGSVGQFLNELLVDVRIRPLVETDPKPVKDIKPFVHLRETGNRHMKRFEAKGELPPHIPNPAVDAEIADRLTTERAVLLEGPSKSGKTHAAFTAVRDFAAHHTLISPRPSHLSDVLDALDTSKPRILWLDDLNRYAADPGMTVDALHKFLEPSEHMIVATIRSTQAEKLRDDDTDTTRDAVKVLDWLSPLVFRSRSHPRSHVEDGSLPDRRSAWCFPVCPIGTAMPERAATLAGVVFERPVPTWSGPR